jgi:multiple sugar transport system permease protein
VLRHAVPLLVAVPFWTMLLWVVAGSLRQPGLPPPRSVEWLPDPLWWSNYSTIFSMVPLGRYALNSLLVVALAVPITLVSASWAGFAMTLLGHRVRRKLVVVALLLLMVPITALWLPRFVLFEWLGITNSVLALIAPAFMGSSPFFVLLYFWTFRRIPKELFDCAQLDGAGVLRVWRSVALPLAAPTTAAVAVLTFVMYWSDFLTPFLYLRSEKLYTLAIGVQTLQQLDRTGWPLLMAGAVVMIAPNVGLFLLVQRYFWREGRERAWALESTGR